MEEFPGGLPGNSHISKTKKEAPTEEDKASNEDPKPEVRKARQVVTGKVTTRRKPLGTRLKNMFASEDGDTFANYLFENVIVPMAKDMVLSLITQTADGIRGGIEERLFGPQQATRTRTTSYGTGRPTVNYTNYSSSSGNNRPGYRPTTPAPRVTIRRSNEVPDIELDSREQGENIIEELTAVIDGVGHCTVGDLYATIGMQPNQTDEGWGWDSVQAARVRLQPSTGRYLLMMPRPIEIQN